MEQLWMKEALIEAEKALQLDEVPVGCVIVKNNKIIARTHNMRHHDLKISGHAEILALEAAAKELNDWRLEECDLYVTLEPCFMCAGAIVQARIRTVYFGAYDQKGGAFGSVYDLSNVKPLNHTVNLYAGVLKEPCETILTTYFRKKRVQP